MPMPPNASNTPLGTKTLTDGSAVPTALGETDDPLDIGLGAATAARTRDMAPSSRLPSDIATEFVKSRSGFRFISTADGIPVLRAELPDCSLSDHALANLVAAAALAWGRNVSFEKEIDRPPPILPVRSSF